MPFLKAGLSITALFKLAGDVMAALPDLELMAKDIEAGKVPSPADVAALLKLVADVKAVFA